VIEEEKQEELTAFLKEFEGGGDLDEVLDEAFDEFGDYYSEEEIRLMRIKFIADFAN
jgi:hypothetical protein